MSETHLKTTKLVIYGEFKVVSEVGSKDQAKLIAPYKWIELMQEELKSSQGPLKGISVGYLTQQIKSR